jgi:1-acyl-sn-glycerol-3-phosphate acyltransferase
MPEMSTSLPHEQAAAPDWLRPLRYLVRVPVLLLHLLIALPFTLLAVTLSGARWHLPGGERFDHRMIRWWSGALVRVFGFRVEARGEPVPGAVLLVANHLTWLDIELIHSQRMACFVAKSEIERWPFVGWLTKRAGTIFHRRGSTESLGAVQQVMVQRLREGLAVAVFPEGGTGPGGHVRTFHARIFQAALDAQVPAQPVALKFSRDGAANWSVAFRERESFMGNFLRVLGEPTTRAEVIFLDPVAPDAAGRRRLAEACRSQIVSALGFAEPGRAAAGSAPEPATDDLDPLANGDAAG